MHASLAFFRIAFGIECVVLVASFFTAGWIE